MFVKAKNDAHVGEQALSTTNEQTRAQIDGSISTLGVGVVVNGVITCNGPMVVFGKILGEIHAVKLSIGEGGHVEGQIIAEETTVAGYFKGTIHSKSVKLGSTAVVEGEIYKNTLVIDQDAQFEGLARKLDKPLELPTHAPLVVSHSDEASEGPAEFLQ